MRADETLSTSEVPQDGLSDRQREVARLMTRYYEVSQELPSYGWIARRLSISRQTARDYVEILRRKGWCVPR